MKIRTVVAAALASGLLGITLAASADAGVSPASFLVAKKPSGEYSDFGVRISLEQGKTKTVYVKSRSNDPGNVAVALRQPIQPLLPWKTKFFTRSGNNITAQVQSIDGYEFTATPDQAKRFEVKIKRGSSGPNSMCVDFRLELPAGESILTVAVNRTLASCA